MTDNSSLVPSQSSPNFAQQGQVDWVAVAQTPVAFTLEVLARYGKAGVDGLTVGIARAVCSQFDLKPAAQKRLDESISKLKTIHSFGKIAWFGFGLKHIIDDLLETEQGAACVALSGCLTACYDTDFASQVFRSMCQSKGAPKSLTPSLRQWSALVRVCAGSLTGSQFPLLLSGFERLLAKQLRDPGLRTPPESETLTKAIIILGSLSKGNLRGAEFSGGLDCAWIAAMAEWMLSLGVEINDSSGNTLYRSKSLSSSEIAHVIINIVRPSLQYSSGLTHKTFLIPSGENVIRHNSVQVELFSLRGTVRRSVPWTEILDATFGKKRLLSLLHTQDHAFAAIIERAVSFLNPNRAKYDVVRTDLCESSDSQRGIEFLEWAIWRLPELRPYIESSISLSSQFTDLSACWKRLEEACGCRICSEVPMVRFLSQEEFCLKVLAHTIEEYLILLFRLSIDPLVLPSCNGLRLLYAHVAQDLLRARSERVPGFVTKESKLPDIFEYLTGQSFHNDRISQSKSAISANGICIFFNIFSDLDISPLEINTVQVIPGYIEHEDSQCRMAFDIVGGSFKTRPPAHGEKDFSYNMVVRQKVDEANISVGYQMCIAGDGVELDGLHSILSNAMKRVTPFNCMIWCQEGRHETDKQLPGRKATISDKRSINDRWIAVVLTTTDESHISDHKSYTLEAVRCCYPRMYLDVLWTRPNSRACLVRINNCSKCLLMYALETLFFSFSADRDDKIFHLDMWKPKGVVTIRRWGAEDVRIMLQERDLERISDFNRTPNEVGAVPLFPNVPLDHDPVDWEE